MVDYSLTSGEYAEHLLDEDNEKKISEAFSWSLVPPITIIKVDINMRDDYNGSAHITFSNGDELTYECNEIRGNCGPDTQVNVCLNGTKVMGDEFLEKYCGSGSWVGDLVNFYKQFNS